MSHAKDIRPLLRPGLELEVLRDIGACFNNWISGRVIEVSHGQASPEAHPYTDCKVAVTIAGSTVILCLADVQIRAGQLRLPHAVKPDFKAAYWEGLAKSTQQDLEEVTKSLQEARATHDALRAECSRLKARHQPDGRCVVFETSFSSDRRGTDATLRLGMRRLYSHSGRFAEAIITPEKYEVEIVYDETTRRAFCGLIPDADVERTRADLEHKQAEKARAELEALKAKLAGLSK